MPIERPPHCPKCGEIGSLKTENYGMFHTITTCSNCGEKIIKDKETQISNQQNNIEMQTQYAQPAQATQPAPAQWQQPAQQPQGQQQQQKTLAPVRLFPAHPNAPDFVLASAVIGLDEFCGFIQQNPHLLTEYQGKKQLKIQILRSKEGRIYSVVDDYRPAPQPAQQPAQWGGHTTSPVAPAPQQQPAGTWGAQPAAQPAGTWGAQPAQNDWSGEGQLPF